MTDTRRPSRGGVDRNYLKAGGGLATRGHVAPLVGAWIETIKGWRRRLLAGCRPSRGGVDRNYHTNENGVYTGRRPSRGGVDRNLLDKIEHDNEEGRPSRGGVDRNDSVGALVDCLEGSPLSWGRGSKRVYGVAQIPRLGRPSRGGVDRNIEFVGIMNPALVAPLVGAWIETPNT